MLRVLVTLGALSLISFTAPGTGSATEEPVAKSENAVAAVSNVTDVTMSYNEKQAAFEDHIQKVYTSAGLAKLGMNPDVFRKAYIGFQNLKQEGAASPSKSVLTVIDFTQHSNKKRLWTIDLSTNKVLMNSLVAHGRNTGNAEAVKFSNTPDSYMSSLGFYVTNKTYFGKHGLSLKLTGMDAGFNTNAMRRAIVVHGADYATAGFIKQYGRLGRSLGCPAVPTELSKELIENIKDETVMYIHGSDSNYKSDYLNEKAAVEMFAASLQPTEGQYI